MIQVTRLNGSVFYINEDHIEFMEETPDTVITLNTEKKIIVVESVAELIDRITTFKRGVFLGETGHLVKGE